MVLKKITVKASDEYDIIIGKDLIHDCYEYIKTAVKSDCFAVITDDNVDEFYGNTVVSSLKNNGKTVCKLVFPHGEASKSTLTLNSIYEFLCENNITRTDCIIALGGGVTGDIAGFAAATYLRGIDYVQIPTSLLAQVDSSVGGKTAVDLPGGKNLVGAFKQPKLVLCDTGVLKTLPRDYFVDGMGEVIKYGMIKSAELFEILENHDIESIHSVLDEVILKCISIKRDIVEEDEFDKGERMLLNFGHTIGHSIEKYYNFSGISHGMAVASGMKIITRNTEDKNITKKGVYNKLVLCLAKYYLNEIINPPVSELIPACLNDKKREGGFINIIICEDIGKSFYKKLSFDEFTGFMN